MNLRTHKTVTDRRKALERELAVDLKNIGHFSLDETMASSRNCENMIGVAQIPMGIAGPLKIRFQPKEYYVPLATTEGALVASVNRGCKAIAESGGALVHVERVGASRGPVFRVSGLDQGRQVMQWVAAHEKDLYVLASAVSSHISLLSVETQMVGKNVFVRFAFDTSDAMGMNMVTIATTRISQTIEKETGAVLVAAAGNIDSDKKPSWISLYEGRGRKVWAEAVISREVVAGVLKTTPEQIAEVGLRKTLIGSAVAGLLGHNNHAANVIAAVYIATGQDGAHVVEGSLTMTTAEVDEDKNLYVSVYVPAVLVGTVGGGTGLATQAEALRIMGVDGGGKGEHADAFAGIVGAAVLAGEVSLLASLATNTLACAHQVLARGGK
ncbi:hydroxymethylglutaryl-CoA reductase [Candidatus Gottesmanbacteria bacterium]|nr:hydroxymethylglutaryl-CoA reductase [Candidatus Gottesmanbacteria bacterium]